MEFDYIINKDQIVDFHVKHIDKTESYKKTILIMIALWWSSAFILIKFLSEMYYTVLIIIVVLICTVFYRRIFSGILRKKLKEYYSCEKYKDMFKCTHIKISDIGIKSITKSSEKLYKWEGIDSIYAVDNYLFVKTLLGEDLLIPIRKEGDINIEKSVIEHIVQNFDFKIINSYPANLKYF